MPALSVSVPGVSVTPDENAAEILTPKAVEFVVELHRRFEPERQRLLRARRERQARISRGERPEFLPHTAPMRDGDWRVPPAPADLRDRRVEITGPTDRKMMLTALNSGANVYMADFEDAASPLWPLLLAGQRNLQDFARGRLEHEAEGRRLGVGKDHATLVVRPRGWHLSERHLLVDGAPISASLFDAGLFVFHNARELLGRRSGPYLYLPKMENHHEARLWADVFAHLESSLDIPRGSIRATVLIETILAAFEMEEILYELRDHITGLNAGRWDYIFSIIKKFRHDPDFLLPDRSRVTMDVPFMRAYARLLVKTCHRRGAHAIGGMAAFIPNRRDAEKNAAALAKVRADKEREVEDGFDGTWVAHPDLVPTAREAFEDGLRGRTDQLARQRDDEIQAQDLLDVRIPGARVTFEGVRNNVSVGLRYLHAWLSGRAAVALNDLMEDAATAEIARAQLWQWTHHGARLADGRAVTAQLVRQLAEDERSLIAREGVATQTLGTAYDLFLTASLHEEFVDFLTLPAYERLP